MFSVRAPAPYADPAPKQERVYFQKPPDYKTGIEEEDKSSSRRGNRSPSCVGASERHAWPPCTTWRACRRTPTRAGTRLPPPLCSPPGCGGLRFGAGRTKSSQTTSLTRGTAPHDSRSLRPGGNPASQLRQPTRSLMPRGYRLPSPTGVRARRTAFLPAAHPILIARDRLYTGRTLLTVRLESEGRPGIPAGSLAWP